MRESLIECHKPKVCVRPVQDMLYILCLPGSISAPEGQLWGRLMAGVIVTAGCVQVSFLTCCRGTATSWVGHASDLPLQGCRLAEDAGEGLDLLHRAVLRHVGHTPPPDSQVGQLRLAPEVTASPVFVAELTHSIHKLSCLVCWGQLLLCRSRYMQTRQWQLCTQTPAALVVCSSGKF